MLADLADLIASNSEAILKANQLDLSAGLGNDEALYDRLKVDDAKIQGMIDAIKQVIDMPDPIGQVLYQHHKAEGLTIENRVVPMGRILIIYESRPDVTIEAAITAFKAGNTLLLKGGKEARNSNLALVNLWHQALQKNQQGTQWVQYLDLDREQTQTLISQNTHSIDLIIPRGGEQLINSIKANTDVPMIISGRGNNFVYIDENADFEVAGQIILDGKKRISVCNAVDKVLIHHNNPKPAITQLIQTLQGANIEVIGDADIQSMADDVTAAQGEPELYEEFLAAKILLTLTPNLDQAIHDINRYSGGHSAAIISSDTTAAATFQQQVDCAAVYHNASTRFTDGGAFGLGAEIAISTQKLHFRGPVGLNELVTNKWFINGNGHVRG